jgi:predicted nuclease with TOPRIM domain
MNITDWVTIVVGILAPLVSGVGAMVINGMRSAIRTLRDDNRDLADSLDRYKTEVEQWRREIPEKYVNKTELRDMTAQLLGRLDRMENKLDQVLHRSE